MGDQRRSSWPWRKLKSSSTTAKAGDKSSRFSPSQLVSPASSFKATESARFNENLSQEATPSAFVEDGRLLEANALREQAEESLRALKQELSIVMREVMAKEAQVKQHQKVADEAVSGWEKAEKEALSFKQDLESAAQQRIILEDRVAQLDGALKECMRQVRYVRDEQAGKIEDAITCKTREWEQVKTELEARQAELQRRLMESDAQNSAMTKSLQERARKILEANEAKSKAETELKVVQVKLGSTEKDLSSLQYELNLLSKELEIRNEEVGFCKKSADIAHKQHLDNVQKVAKLEADCQRLRSLIKKKLPGPAAIAQMRKEVEGLPQIRESNSATADQFKRRPSRSYASSTVSFTNSHQRAGAASSVNRDMETLRERLFSMEEENKLLKEALSKRIGELQTSWLLCAKTASKLSIAEDQLESLQGTPRGARMNGSDFNFSATRAPSIASASDENGFGGNEYDEEASCAESWASALIGELAHFRKEKITTKEAIKEVTESYNAEESLSSLENGRVLHAKEVVLDKEECPVNVPLPEAEKPANVELGNPLAHQDDQLQALRLLCKDLDHKLTAIEEQLRTGRESEKEEPSTTGNLEKESVINLVDAAHQKFSELEKAIQGMGSMPMQSIPDHAVSIAAATMPSSESGLDVEMPMPRASNNSTSQEMDPMPLQANGDHMVAVAASCTSICEGDESRQGVTMLTPTTSITPILTAAVAEEEHLRLAPPTLKAASISIEDESKMSALVSGEDQNCKSITEDKDELARPVDNLESTSLGFALGKLIAVLEKLIRGATLDADCTGEEQWEQEKQGVVACKDRLLVGRSSVLEFVVRVGMVVCRACHAGAGELEELLGSLKNGDEVAQVDEHVNAAGVTMPCQHQEANNKAEELEAHVAQLGRQLAEVQREREEGREKLEAEVAIHRKLEAKCEELEQKLQGFEMEEDRPAVKQSHGEDTNLRKESELVEAKQKLAECERTMVVLGKQLHSLSSLNPPPHHPHNTHIGPHFADVDDPGTHIYAFDADVHQPPRPRGRTLPCHVVSGPQDNHFFQQSGSVHVAHTQHMRARRQRYVDAASWQKQPVEEYSPPLSAMSSPARSPGRYVQQVSGGRRANIARTSLTQSLNAPAPTPAGASFGKLFSRSKHNR